jgi:hypothetical protein
VKRVQICYNIEALFHTSKFFISNPPSLLGLQSVSHKTLACTLVSFPPLQETVKFLLKKKNNSFRQNKNFRPIDLHTKQNRGDKL